MSSQQQPSMAPAQDGSAAKGGVNFAVVALVIAVVGIIAIGLVGSYNPLRDSFLACHQARGAADWEPFAVDGLIAVALVAAIVLQGNVHARRYALGVVIGYTVASVILNFLHAAGVIPAQGHTSAHPLPKPLVLLISALPVASIGLGSHLFIYCLVELSPRLKAKAESAKAEADRAKAAKAVAAAGRKTSAGTASPRTGDQPQRAAGTTPINSAGTTPGTASGTTVGTAAGTASGTARAGTGDHRGGVVRDRASGTGDRAARQRPSTPSAAAGDGTQGSRVSANDDQILAAIEAVAATGVRPSKRSVAEHLRAQGFSVRNETVQAKVTAYNETLQSTSSSR